MLTTRTVAAPVLPTTGRLRPLGLDEVRITGGFWAGRQQTNAATTLPHIAHWLEREGWIGNYDLAAAGTLPEGRRGREFADSEIYKFLEAAAWELGRQRHPQLEATFRDFVARVAAAQEPDGYVGTAYGKPGQQPRWSDLSWGHELYCLGHLFQAAVARERTRPGADDGLLGIARRAADLVCDVFGDNGIASVCGHPEVEVGLAELGRLTGEQRYLHQAAVFIDRRGHQTLPEPEWGRSYFQDDVPVREADVLRGHAVRANYLAAGAVDVAVETGDDALLAALRQQWKNTVSRRTYLTGGQGSHFQDESFGEDWELPPDRAYAETCASIASIMFSWRLLLATGGPGYGDLIERSLFNVVATAVSREGNSFFYTNTLHRRAPGEMPDPDAASPRAFSSLRAPWFDVSCCPPNIARTIASLAGLLATVDDNGVQLHQFAPSEISTTLPDGTLIGLEVATTYPESGTVTVRVLQEASRAWTLSLRVPEWATGATLTHRTAGGQTTVVPADVPLAGVTARFAAGDVVELELPMTARFVHPDPRIDSVRGCVAVQRGPVVFCAEQPDGTATDLDRLVVAVEHAPAYVDGQVVVSAHWRQLPEAPWPYGSEAGTAPERDEPLALIPYHGWGQAGLCSMRVWLPRE
jgi:uncharacterized protein